MQHKSTSSLHHFRVAHNMLVVTAFILRCSLISPKNLYTEQRFEHNVVMITSQKTSLLMDNWFSYVISFYFLDSILLNLLSLSALQIMSNNYLQKITWIYMSKTFTIRKYMYLPIVNNVIFLTATFCIFLFMSTFVMKLPLVTMIKPNRLCLGFVQVS